MLALIGGGAGIAVGAAATAAISFLIKQLAKKFGSQAVKQVIKQGGKQVMRATTSGAIKPLMTATAANGLQPVIKKMSQEAIREMIRKEALPIAGKAALAGATYPLRHPFQSAALAYAGNKFGIFGDEQRPGMAESDVQRQMAQILAAGGPDSVMAAHAAQSGDMDLQENLDMAKIMKIMMMAEDQERRQSPMNFPEANRVPRGIP